MKMGNYLPGTFTSRRRPTPTEFAHLRKWVEPIEKNIELKSITEITNINQQLEQTSSLFLNNIISRVIAQIIGKYGDGFVTIEATADGELKVFTDDKSPTVLKAVIDIATAVTHTVVAAVAGKKIKVCNLMFTVGGEVNITLKSDTDALSGALDFGGTDEPRGMTHHLGDYPLETATGKAFKITLSAAVQVSGYITYILE